MKTLRIATFLGGLALGLILAGSAAAQNVAHVGGYSSYPYYVVPRPVHPVVGTTYILYEPLMPHHFLYRHSRTYVRTNGGRPVNTTRVFWW